MGSVGLGNNALLGAFVNRVFPEGLDLGRCQIRDALGIFVADPTSTFRAGMLVMLNSSGLVVASDAEDVLGVAKWNHATTQLAVVVDEAIVLPGTDVVPLKHALVSNVRVASALVGGGTVYTAGGTDYTLNTTNGTVQRAGGGAITDGQTVYVTYTFQIPQADLLATQGQNFWNNLDEVSQADGRVTVITDADLLFTSQYDTSANYALTGANSELYVHDTQDGLFTSANTSGLKVGRVQQVPTAADPFLGLRLFRMPVGRP